MRWPQPISITDRFSRASSPSRRQGLLNVRRRLIDEFSRGALEEHGLGLQQHRFPVADALPHTSVKQETDRERKDENGGGKGSNNAPLSIAVTLCVNWFSWREKSVLQGEARLYVLVANQEEHSTTRRAKPRSIFSISKVPDGQAVRAMTKTITGALPKKVWYASFVQGY